MQEDEALHISFIIPQLEPVSFILWSPLLHCNNNFYQLVKISRAPVYV